MGKTYVIEHMEADEQIAQRPMPEWVVLEYQHILQQIGVESLPENNSVAVASPTSSLPSTPLGSSSRAVFANLTSAGTDGLIDALNKRSDRPIARSLKTLASTPPAELARPDRCTCTVLPVLELMSAERVSLSEVCLLDPRAEQAIGPSDALRFRWFLFGGILGDDPPQDRTAQLRKFGFPSRHLGPVQMTTDTAVAVTKRVIEDGKKLDKLLWTDRPTITFGPHESVEMPFRYLADEAGEPIMPKGMKELIRKDMDRAFEF
ncbi:hypothetical protein CROQUDRAFT_328233 [Cronartium quercuum f. sp. fusiforme G11]|uniref:DUF431-domain-containing protein n=1 Tax=Cronartium quercuum f. sp. fusiforme G11 TaxID=708437 RepID=A0A9P6NAU2_9BASI|nr:hypothetical protein CROQUDRAFT_328233 [Cronartium quercuum f. sp. fusiforme G11]